MRCARSRIFLLGNFGPLNFVFDHITLKLITYSDFNTCFSFLFAHIFPFVRFFISLSLFYRLQKIEFQSYTGTALYPTAFSLKYEFVDTDLGGEKWLGRKGEEPIPPLCSRMFRKKRGNFQSPRNVFLHGRGGAKNLTCLYRFEAGVGEKVSHINDTKHACVVCVVYTLRVCTASVYHCTVHRHVKIL